MTNAIVTRHIALSYSAQARAEEIRKGAKAKGAKAPNLKAVRRASGLSGAGPARLQEEAKSQARARAIAEKGNQIEKLEEELALLQAQRSGCAPSQRGELDSRINKVRKSLAALRPDKHCGSDTRKGGKARLASPKTMNSLGDKLRAAGVC